MLENSADGPKIRLEAYKSAYEIWRHQHEHGLFSPLFRTSVRGFHIYEHRLGYVAVLQKDRIHLAYRDLDPQDFPPYLLYSETEAGVREKIAACYQNEKYADTLWRNWDYFSVYLRKPEFKPTKFPRLQTHLKLKHRRKKLDKIYAALRKPKKLSSRVRLFRARIVELWLFVNKKFARS